MSAGHYKFPQETIDKIRRLRQVDPESWPYSRIMKEFNISRGQVSKILNRAQRKTRIDIDDGDVSKFEETHYLRKPYVIPTDED